MKSRASRTFHKIFGTLLVAAVIGIFGFAAQAAKVSLTLQSNITNLAGNASVGVDGTVTQIKYTLPTISDIIGHPQQAAIEQAIKSRLIDTNADGSFQPNAILSRGDLARTLISNKSPLTSLKAAPRFTDVSGDLARIAEAVTANGSTNRDYNFAPKGLMSAGGFDI